jgi:hypothetical protein
MTGAGNANPAEVLHRGNTGIRKDLGASSRSTGLPQRTASSLFLFSLIPRRELYSVLIAVEERPFRAASNAQVNPGFSPFGFKFGRW